ncbi:MAG: 2-hydroxyacyl-CoA dehydratase [Defluviitaleaceae bacterium]|nr:2-hydroxyacyl-CoA dehydratase [Defluviitaleaceae bacterium]MCL2262814.1 2-hydroxyacyl-CoA dehydratase [Defluviitaleaceae bacterium]MCL2263870.1 2-hydroxyacyl-CoA dehydratase [Defluviitaleaceae bacterium]
MELKNLHNLPIVKFTPEMKETHTLLVPMMLPIHFELVEGAIRNAGYKTALLKTSHKEIAEEGLRNVHNDMCYPALLIIGQLIDALKSGEYDLDKTAVFITQTGGGCRASNYLSLLRKALYKNGFGHVPIASFNVSNPDSTGGIDLNKRDLLNIILSLLYGDILMRVHNQCVPYEIDKGSSQAVVDDWVSRLISQMSGAKFMKTGANFRDILRDFSLVARDTSRKKMKVGIVGEIYIKYSPLGNNGLEEYLVNQGVEVINSGMMEFAMYRFYSMLHETKLYGGSLKRKIILRLVMFFFLRKQREMINAIKKNGNFDAHHEFTHTIKMCDGYLDHGVKMGEGWLLTAEMLELIHNGINNIVAVQPFGCLPNHIVAKGMSRKIKDNFPSANIVALDYDPGSSLINQENRLRLMLANAK